MSPRLLKITRPLRPLFPIRAKWWTAEIRLDGPVTWGQCLQLREALRHWQWGEIRWTWIEATAEIGQIEPHDPDRSDEEEIRRAFRKVGVKGWIRTRPRGWGCPCCKHDLGNASSHDPVFHKSDWRRIG